MSNLIASIIFFATGIIILYLKAAGKLGMGNLEGYQNNNGRRNLVNQYVGGNLI